MDVTKPYEFMTFGAMDVTKPCKFIRFGAMDVTKPYEFIWFGAMDVVFNTYIASSLVSLCRSRYPRLWACERGKALLVQGLRLTPTSYQYNHENLFLRDPEIIKFWGLDGPGRRPNPKNIWFLGPGKNKCSWPYVTKPYEFIWFGAMDVTKPYEFIGLGAMDTWPY